MDGTALFYYFGDDEAYFRSLMGEYKKNIRFTSIFKRFYESDEKKIQSFFLKVFMDKPQFIFIDFSKQTQDYIHLARILARTKLDHKCVKIGLVDYLSPPEVLKESIATGVDLSFIKSAELFDVVYDSVKILSPEDIGEHGFATATLKDDQWEVGAPVKVGYVHSEGVHLETNFPLNEGSQFKLKHFWIDKKIVPSQQTFVKSITTRNLFYHFKFACELDFLFIDEFNPPEGMEAEEIETRKNEREDKIKNSKKMLKDWVTKNIHDSLEKKAKVLVIDPHFHFYNNQPRTDKASYTIRCVPTLHELESEFEHHDPQVVAFRLDNQEVDQKSSEDKKPEESANDQSQSLNTLEKLSEIMKLVREKFLDKKPFFVIFNSSESSKELQGKFSYENIMATHSDLSVELLVRMATIFDEKLQKRLPTIKNASQKVFIKKSHPASIAEILIPISILKLSEIEMIFQCEKEIPTGAQFHIVSPVDMYITVQPAKGQGKLPEYLGLIHGISESSKKDLRRHINLIFFRDHDAQLEAELDEFKKLNELKLNEKIGALEQAQNENKDTSDKSEEKKNDQPIPESKEPKE